MRPGLSARKVEARVKTLNCSPKTPHSRRFLSLFAVKKQKPVFILQVLLVCAVLIGLLVGPWTFQRAKRWQAQRLFDQALVHEEAGQRQAALQKAEASRRLQPENDAVLLFLARMSLLLSEAPENMHAWWQQAMRSEDLRTEDILHYVEYLLATGDMRRAYPLIASLRQLAPDNERAVNLQSRVLLQSRQLAEAEEILTAFVDGHPDAGPETRMLLAQTYLRYEAAEKQERAQQILLDLATSEGETRYFALRQIVDSAAFDDERRIAAAESLLQMPGLSIADHLAAYTTLHNSGRLTRDEVRDRLIALLDTTEEDDPDALARVAAWLLNSGQSRYLLSMLELEDAQDNNNLYIARLLAMIQVGQAEQAYDLTLDQSDRNPLSQVENLIVRAYALTDLGRPEELEATLNSLVDASDGSTFNLVEEKLLEFGAWEQLLRHYEQLRDNQRARPYARRKLLLAYYYLGRERELLSLLEEFDSYEEEEEPSTQALLSYLNALYGRDRATALETAERLVTRYPNIIDFRVVLAFNLMRRDQVERANEILEGLPPLESRHQRYLQIAVAAVRRAADTELSQATARLDASFEDILPAETNLLRNL